MSENHDRLINWMNQVDTQSHSSNRLPLWKRQKPSDEATGSIVTRENHPTHAQRKSITKCRKIDGVGENSCGVMIHLHEGIESENDGENYFHGNQPHYDVECLRNERNGNFEKKITKI